MASVSSVGIGSGLDLSGLIENLVNAERAPVQNTLDRQQNRFTTELSGVGIFKNDFLNVELNVSLADGDIAVVKLGPKIYIRKIFFDKKRIRMETDSKTPSPFIIDRETPGFEIIGKVTTVIREL